MNFLIGIFLMAFSFWMGWACAMCWISKNAVENNWWWVTTLSKKQLDQLCTLTRDQLAEDR